MTPWLLVAGDFTPLGGMDMANYALARYLAGRTSVHLATHRAWPDLASLPGVTVHRAWRPLGRHTLGAAWLAREGRRAARRLAPEGVRVVVNGGNCCLPVTNWVHFLHAAYRPAVTRGVLRGARAAWTAQRDLADERRALSTATLVICNSGRTRTDVVERLSIDPSRVHVVYYGSDPTRLAKPDSAARRAARTALALDADRPVVGFVGALGDRRKGFDTVFDAWRGLCRTATWDAVLVVIGSGAELPVWRRRAAEAGLTGRIRFVGFRADVPELLPAFDALVHPARYEAYGLSVREALTRGVPALVSATAGVAEHYPSSLADLLIVNPDDAGELAERLRTWRSGVERFRSAVTPLADELRRRSWDVMAAEIERLVETAR